MNIKEYRKSYYLKNKDIIKQRSDLRYKTRHDEIRLQSMRRYYDDLIGVMLDRSKQRAKKFGLIHSIKREDIVIPEYCPILQLKLERSFGGVAKPNSPSLDRIDSRQGYVPGNVQVISYKANCMKNNASAEELYLFSKYFLSGAEMVKGKINGK